MRVIMYKTIDCRLNAVRLCGELCRRFLKLGLLAGIVLLGVQSKTAYAVEEYLLTPGDVIKVSVFKNPDLTVDARVSEVGTIGFPLLGSVPVGGLTLPAAERK